MGREVRKGCLWILGSLALLYAIQVAIGIWEKSLSLGESLVAGVALPAALALAWTAVLVLDIAVSLWSRRHRGR